MSEIEIQAPYDELIARIVNKEDVYMYTKVLSRTDAIALAKKILEVMDNEDS
jgi:hypothetical protein